MGLKSPIEKGLTFFGTRARMVALTSLNNLLEENKDFIALITFSPTIGHAAFKNQLSIHLDPRLWSFSLQSLCS
jgi:hypothetical protein